ncbi:MAG TPA: bifunctional DNA primase/polymerase, partial [Acidimicrobiia bacterium]
HLLHQYPAGRFVGLALPALSGFDGVDVRGAGGLIVAPPSLHVSGRRYRWRDDPITVPPEPLPSALLVGTPLDPSSMPCPEDVDPYGWAVMIRECEAIARAGEGARNTGTLKAASRVGRILRATGLEEDVALGVLFDAATSTGLGEEEALSIVERGLQWGMDRPRHVDAPITSREDALEELAHLRARFMVNLQPGHRGTRTHQVLEALHRMAEHAGGPANFRAGTRRIALEAGITPETATRALLELREDGWLVRLKCGINDQPSAWSLRIPPDVQSPHMSTLNESLLVRPLHVRQAPVGHDAFRGRVPLLTRDVSRRGDRPFDFVPVGLRGTGWQMFERLCAEGRSMRVSELATAINKDPSTIRRNLPRLVEHGLIEREGPYLSAIPRTEAELDKIADRLDTAGAAIEQRRSHGWTVPDGLLPEQQTAVAPPKRPAADERIA